MKIASKQTKSTRHISVLKSLSTLTLAAMGVFGAAAPASATTITLGSALASFAVLGALGVTNVPTSTIGGNLGSAPNASVGGGYIFTSGSLQPNTALAQQAQLDLDAAITDLNLLPFSSTLGPDLTGTISPGVYAVTAGTTNLSGNLYLDGTGFGNNAVWVFQMEDTLITSTTSNVYVTNVGDGANVGIYWTVASAATLNGPTFAGNVFANTLISSDGNLTACGRLASATAQVTLDHDTISITGCSGTSGGYAEGVAIGSGGEVIPEPGSLALLGLGLAALGFVRRRHG